MTVLVSKGLQYLLHGKNSFAERSKILVGSEK